MDKFFSNHTSSFEAVMKSQYLFDADLLEKFTKFSVVLSNELIPNFKKSCTDFKEFYTGFKDIFEKKMKV